MEPMENFTLWPTNNVFANPANLEIPSIPSPLLRKYPKACIVCRDRKVKCDRQLPCSTCRRWGIQDCVYPSPIRISPRPRRAENASSRTSGNGGSDKALLERMRKLEIMVQKLGGNIDAESSTDNSGSPADSTFGVTGFTGLDGPRDSGRSSEKGIGRLVTKNSRIRYLSPEFWVDVDEVDDLDILVEPDSPATSESSQPTQEEDSNNFPFGPSNTDVRWMHPPTAEKELYWRTFCERVDPLIKILHKPTIEKIILQDEESLVALDKSNTALIFGIYYSAIMSLTENEVNLKLNQSRACLVKFFRIALEKALNGAGFLDTQELPTLQAFLLYMICSRHDSPKSIWTLCGLARRLAQSMGLHRDGIKLGLSPLDTENRRRVWWQVWYLDVRSSEDHGSESSAMNLDFDTEMPLNINDSDLDPNVTRPFEDRDGLTDMTFCRIRLEMARAACWIKNGTYGSTMSAKEKILNDVAQRIQTKYLQYCHDGDTLYWLMENITLMLIDKSWFTLYHSPTWLQGAASMSRGLQDRLLTLAVQIIERTQRMEHDPRAEKWVWLSRNYFQWLPRAFILAELCTREPSDLVTRAWKAIDETFVVWSETTANSKNGILLKRLMAKASAKRKAATRELTPRPDSGDVFLMQQIPPSQYPNGPFGETAASTFGGVLPDSDLQFWNQQPAPYETTDPAWSSTNYPPIDVTNDPIYTGNWNHLTTDFGAIISYDCTGLAQYPNIGPGV